MEGKRRKEKIMHGQFLWKMQEGVDKLETWRWLRKADLKVETGADMCCTGTGINIDKNGESLLCRMCGKKGESVNHITRECSMLAQKEYKRRYHNLARIIHWNTCRKYKLMRAEKWYEH